MSSTHKKKTLKSFEELRDLIRDKYVNKYELHDVNKIPKIEDIENDGKGRDV